MREKIISRLAGTRPQPHHVVQRPGWGDIPEIFRSLRPRELTPAAVLVGLCERDGELHVLLTRRAAGLKHHGGQVSFPGGRIEVTDDGPLAAALRETEEEVGVSPEGVEVAGYLDNYFTITGYSVTPVVGFYDGTTPYSLDEREVDEAFEVPLRFLFDPANHRRKKKNIYGHEIPYFEIHWQKHNIWGATASMIVCFYQAILGKQS